MDQFNNQVSFQEFKMFSPEEKDFFVFTQLSKVDDIYKKLELGERRFAGKWVEKAMKLVITLVVLAVIVAVLAKIGLQPPTELQ